MASSDQDDLLALQQLTLSRKNVDATKNWSRPSRIPNPGCVFPAISGVPNSRLDSHLDGLNRSPHIGSTVRRPSSQPSKKSKNKRNHVPITIEFGDDEDEQDRRDDQDHRDDQEDQDDRDRRDDRDELEFLRAQNEDLRLQNRMLREQLTRTESKNVILETTNHEKSREDFDVLTRFFRAYMTLLVLFNTICKEVFKNKVEVEGYGSSLMKMFEIITNYEFCSKKSVFGDFDIKIKGKPKRFDEFFKVFKNYCVNSGGIIAGSHLVIINLKEPHVLRKRGVSGSCEFRIFSFDIVDISKVPIQAVKVDIVFDDGTTVWCGDLCVKTLVISKSGISSVNPATKKINCFFSYMWNLMNRQTKATWNDPHELTPYNIQMLLRVLKFQDTGYKLHKVPQIEMVFCSISQDNTKSVSLTGCKCSKPVSIGISVFPDFTKNNKCIFCKGPLTQFVLTDSPLVEILDKEMIKKLFSDPDAEKKAEFDHKMSIYGARPLARMMCGRSTDVDIRKLLAYSSEPSNIHRVENPELQRPVFFMTMGQLARARQELAQVFMPAGQELAPASQELAPASQELAPESQELSPAFVPASQGLVPQQPQQPSFRDLVIQSSSRQPGIFQTRRWRGSSPRPS